MASLDVVDRHLNDEGVRLADHAAATKVVVLMRTAFLQNSDLVEMFDFVL